MICEKPTRRYPKGRTGTYAGYKAHVNAKEAVCPDCRQARRDLEKEEYASLPEEKKKSRREQVRKWRRKHPDYYKNYYQLDRDAHVARSARWKEDNRDRYLAYVREYSREWRSKNKDKLRIYAHNRRSQKRNAPFEEITLEEIIQKHGKVCYLCESDVDITLPRGLPGSPEMEHIIPISLPGGPGHVIENVCLSHARCNRKKKDRLVESLDLPFDPPGEEW